MKTTMHLFIAGVFFFLITSISFSQNKQLKDHVLFYSSFDGKLAADVSVGDAMIYTAENYKKTTKAKTGLNDPNVVLAKNKGLTGDALHFKKAKTSAVFYKAYKNVGYSNKSWSGTISFWLQLDPNKDLAPGYCDPICITDVRYNDAALWVDFTDHDPRKFRFGALGDLDVWNPENKDDKAKWEKRTVTVNKPPFNKGEWTHIAITFSKVNTTKSVFRLYLNGELKGVIKDVNDPFTWEAEKGKIMLGLGYIGLMDELTVFNKPLDLQEIKFVFELKKGIKTLLQ
ncbi:LamG-like jellyroll fold domain-containing protein [Aquimarina sp. 2201CG5-10]|uniref:LamG-like jellyroll fold domain-containing protein n=1 Tax=Aquimarina callyspongiae TaxID=3098150 RepID=UPI002AB4717C|nr:LamG-like jellyroll fold domain-containing protein [Aquimarina sp. 2201CG5-10]MDY8136044.1 LamG-like jellyroll fold domain-containing protein [Aquimarina sp. 2201CG5-10]